VVAGPSFLAAPNLDGKWQAREHEVVVAPKGAPNVIFLGDSILDRFQHGPGFKVWKQHIAPLGAKDWAVTSSTTQNLLWLLDQGILNRLRPGAVVLLIGTNNLGQGDSVQQTVDGVRACVLAIRSHLPRAGIVLVGLLPRGPDPHGAFRWEVPQVNHQLAALTALGRVRFVDPGKPFLNPNGTMHVRLLPDGTHPSPAGYKLLVDAIRGPLQAFLAHHVP
jgi:lysophospholipase L1-like esterase